MSTYTQPYKKPTKAEEKEKCEFISIMKGAYFQPPKQTETSCEGYRNQYTGQASNVCASCRWFFGTRGGETG